MQSQEIVLEIDETNYEEFLENEIAVLNFFSDWHMNSLMFMPLLEEIADEFCTNSDERKVCFGKINIEESKEIAEKLQVSKIPSIIIFKNGETQEKIDFLSEDILREKINSLLTEDF